VIVLKEMLMKANSNDTSNLLPSELRSLQAVIIFSEKRKEYDLIRVV
jgi:hypothetical protein